ncbi:uncharacterized protein TERG_11704 [Trichophyton rubrum CBS 118892]|uniref:Uncharacterized protein n=1 Tax=Trichophyton rubrum (strain ATCC MYA-4607 / CBS 118892) TaxID=559305 RepID=A0A080WIW4_TRIRC|nr:uncharacterized protein TERG_11704 [Trichophyton rubrum CBS 118892]KFL60562.1 hypothetical protein TERG_11704 [Trichophyton rubrum CBS 118892]
MESWPLVPPPACISRPRCFFVRARRPFRIGRPAGCGYNSTVSTIVGWIMRQTLRSLSNAWPMRGVSGCRCWKSSSLAVAGESTISRLLVDLESCFFIVAGNAWSVL